MNKSMFKVSALITLLSVSFVYLVPTQATAAEPLLPVRALFTQIYGVPSIGNGAADLGIWDKADLKVTLTQGSTVVAGLVTDSVDIAWSAPMPFIAAIAQGAKIKLIGSTSNVFDQYIIVRKDLNVKNLAELRRVKNLKVGITSTASSGNFGVAKLAKKNSWNPKNYSILTLGSLDNLRAALSRGTIDMFTWSAGAAFALRDSGAANLLGNLQYVVGPIPFGMLAASETAIKEKPASIKAFCNGYFSAQTILKKDPAEATKILVAKGGLDPIKGPEIVNSGLKFQASNGKIAESEWQAMADATMLTVPDIKNLTAQDVKNMFVSCDSLK